MSFNLNTIFFINLKNGLENQWKRNTFEPHVDVNHYRISVSHNDHGYVTICRNHNPVLTSFMTYQQVCYKTRVTLQDPHMEQELLNLQEHLSLSLVFIWFCPFFFWQLCCLSFFNLQLLIIPLVSSNYSYFKISEL